MNNLKIDQRDVSLYKIKSEIKNDSINIDNKTEDSIYQKSVMIESMFYSFKPVIYGTEKPVGGVIIIKGNSLINAYLSFANDEFKLTGLNNFKEVEGKLFSELTYHQQTILGRFQIEIRYLNYKHANDSKAIELFNHIINTLNNLT